MYIGSQKSLWFVEDLNKITSKFWRKAFPQTKNSTGKLINGFETG